MGLVLEAQIGTVDGPVALSLPTGALMLGPDTLLLAQWMVGHLLILSADGDSLGVAGRSGSGPGEFSRPIPEAVRGDSLWILDGRTVHLWTRSLEPVSQFTLQIDPLGEFQSAPRPVTMLADGAVLYGSQISTSAGARGQVDTIPVVRVSRDGERIDTLALHSMGGCCFVVRSEDGPGFTGAHPANYSDRMVVDPNGEWIAILAIEVQGGAPRLTVRRIALSGDTLVSFEVPSASIPIGSLREEWTRENCDRLSHWPEGECRRAVEESMEWPDLRPPVEGAFADRNRRIWIRTPHEAPDSSQWILVGNDDQIIGSSVLPSRIHLLTAGGNIVWGWYQGEFDVPYLVRLRIELE
jgi:hypothetical protein